MPSGLTRTMSRSSTGKRGSHQLDSQMGIHRGAVPTLQYPAEPFSPELDSLALEHASFSWGSRRDSGTGAGGTAAQRAATVGADRSAACARVAATARGLQIALAGPVHATLATAAAQRAAHRALGAPAGCDARRRVRVDASVGAGTRGTDNTARRTRARVAAVARGEHVADDVGRSMVGAVSAALTTVGARDEHEQGGKRDFYRPWILLRNYFAIRRWVA